MKSIKYKVILILSAVFALTACHEQYITYSDAEYIMFADTLTIVPVENSKNAVDVPVISTKVCNHDRTFGVEIIDKKSNAIEDLHYRLESNTITIKAGENTTSVKVYGEYDKMEPEDSLCFTMSLVMDETLQMPLYGKETRVQLRKVYPFDINAFEGWAVFTSMFHRQFNLPYQRLVHTKVVQNMENTIICKNMFNEGYDVMLSFNNENILNPLVTMPQEQIISDESSIFGQNNGDNHIRAVHSPLAPSFFYMTSNKPYLTLWSLVYVKNLGEYVGNVGNFYSIMEWVSDQEASRLSRENGLPGYDGVPHNPNDPFEQDKY